MRGEAPGNAKRSVRGRLPKSLTSVKAGFLVRPPLDNASRRVPPKAKPQNPAAIKTSDSRMGGAFVPVRRRAEIFDWSRRQLRPRRSHKTLRLCDFRRFHHGLSAFFDRSGRKLYRANIFSCIVPCRRKTLQIRRACRWIGFANCRKTSWISRLLPLFAICLSPEAPGHKLRQADVFSPYRRKGCKPKESQGALRRILPILRTEKPPRRQI